VSTVPTLTSTSLATHMDDYLLLSDSGTADSPASAEVIHSDPPSGSSSSPSAVPIDSSASAASNIPHISPIPSPSQRSSRVSKPPRWLDVYAHSAIVNMVTLAFVKPKFHAFPSTLTQLSDPKFFHEVQLDIK